MRAGSARVTTLLRTDPADPPLPTGGGKTARVMGLRPRAAACVCAKQPGSGYHVQSCAC